MRTQIIAILIALPLSLTSLAAPAAAAVPAAPLQQAADRMEILELSAHFDNSLDSEDADKFVATFAPDGVLEGFWGQSSGPDGIRQAHAFMLATFAKNKRHVVTNHEIVINGDHATMYCYLTVFDRNALAITGTATFTDTLVKRGGKWLFERRVLKADPNVDSIIAGLKGKE